MQMQDVDQAAPRLFQSEFNFGDFGLPFVTSHKKLRTGLLALLRTEGSDATSKGLIANRSRTEHSY